MANSFVENVNNLANATALVAGDIVQDTAIARDEAVAAANEAKSSATSATNSEATAKAWAENGHNVEVAPGEYSSYHWSVEAQTNTIVGRLSVINDSLVSQTYTWSSQKISDELANKSDSGHLHTGVYEPAFTKGTAFNKNFAPATAETGSGTDVARSDHVHTSLYEPKRTINGTAYNKNFGTTSGTVAEGDHNHDTKYMPLEAKGTAYNKNFVVDVNAPQADEVPRGNHIHAAAGVTYDSTSNKVVTSSTAQGAISQLDGALGSIEVAEKCKLTATMTNNTYVVSFPDTATYVNINAGMSVGAEIKNAIYNNGIQVKYPVAPSKLVEGNYIATASLTMVAGVQYELSMMLNGQPIPGTQVEVGPFTNGDIVPVTAGGFVSVLQNDDIIGIGVRNKTNTTSLTVEGLMVSFAGEPEGNLVVSGSTVQHNEILGRDQVAQHPTSSIYETGNVGVSLDDVLAKKADKVIVPTANNLLAMDAGGNLIDSGLSTISAAGKMDKVATPTLDHIVAMDSNGNSKDGGLRVSDLAKVQGDPLVNFRVASSVVDSDAVNQGQMNALAATYTLQTTFNTHEATANPHNTTYSDVGAAPTVHQHAIADTTGLVDALGSKYDKVLTPGTGNIVVFGAGDTVADSGLPLTNITNAVTKTSNTGAAKMPTGTTAQRDPSPQDGWMRYNTDLNAWEAYSSTVGLWLPIGGGATGGGTDDIFYENSQVVTTNYTITTGKNAVTAGPVQINNGVVVTVPDGSTWSIV